MLRHSDQNAASPGSALGGAVPGTPRARRQRALMALVPVLAVVGALLGAAAGLLAVLLPVVALVCVLAALLVLALMVYGSLLRRRALRRAEVLLQAFAGELREPVSLRDAQGRFLFATRPAAAMLGAEPADVLGYTEGDFLDPEAAAGRAAETAALLTEPGTAHPAPART